MENTLIIGIRRYKLSNLQKKKLIDSMSEWSNSKGKRVGIDRDRKLAERAYHRSNICCTHSSMFGDARCPTYFHT